MRECEFAFEYENKKYPFLNVPSNKDKEYKNNLEYEVTKYSMKMLQDHYKFYNKNKFELVKRNEAVHEMISTPGYTLQHINEFYNKNNYSINVSCDVMTGVAPFRKNETVAFKSIYHTIGNFLPIPEGANFSSGRGLKDHHEHKLNEIKRLFEEDNILTDEDVYQIKERIKIDFGLGKNARIAKIDETNREHNLNLKPLKDNVQLRYWIQFEWKKHGLTWKKYVDKNYLQDFVDKDYTPLPFNKDNSDETLKLIIKRGYRIHNGKKLDDETLNKILKELNIT